MNIPAILSHPGIKAIAITVAIATGVLSATSTYARDFSKVEIKTTKLAEGVYMLRGAGGNIGVLIGDDGVFLIDDQFAPLTKKIKAAIAPLSNKPIRFVLNTHWHFDHTGGNENFGKSGTIIVAHDNVRTTMSKDQFIAAFNKKVPAAAKIALPTITFNDSTTFHLNGEVLHVKHLAPGHTDGDSIVRFRNANVIHTGDLFFNGFYPFIDVQHGGSINGLIVDVAAILAFANDATKIIPGHGPLATKAELTAYRDMLLVVRDNVKKLVDAGKSEAEVIAARPTASLDARWGNGFLKPDKFVKIVYSDLAK